MDPVTQKIKTAPILLGIQPEACATFDALSVTTFYKLFLNTPQTRPSAASYMSQHQTKGYPPEQERRHENEHTLYQVHHTDRR
ncbi:hypothetical protein ASD8599_00889 [Ascidiaceihabitans donghaensis]|uniref:Uncharacterized protein n=1 Tax=Ascidiaceihabitans donghaensis TaxID=1510460 RepID=A0A2R8BAR6_9RHOB|nr:hypothetical protein ASD8599_00889 [Ascidiaceihabitans donghaensis]